MNQDLEEGAANRERAGVVAASFRDLLILFVLVGVCGVDYVSLFRDKSGTESRQFRRIMGYKGP